MGRTCNENACERLVKISKAIYLPEDDLQDVRKEYGATYNNNNNICHLYDKVAQSHYLKNNGTGFDPRQGGLLPIQDRGEFG